MKAELFDIISKNESLVSEQGVKNLLFLCSFLSIEATKLILQTAFYDRLTSKKGISLVSNSRISFQQVYHYLVFDDDKYKVLNSLSNLLI